MKKKWQICHRILIGCLFISLFFIITTFSVHSKTNELENQPRTSNSGWSGGIELEYNKFFAPHADAFKKIDWWFTSYPNISLIVMILDTFYFSEFLTIEKSYGLNATVFDFYFEVFIVANSSENSGEIDLSYNDHWYAVFINIDDNMNTSQVEFRVNFDVYEEKYVYVNPISIIYLIYGVGVSLVIIALVIRAIRKRKILNKPIPVVPYPYMTKEETIPKNSYLKQIELQKVESELPLAKYCPYCGEYLDRDSIFCHQCGNKV
ncbi:MAG: hypothetical protein ACFFC9_08890 [Promethearchaeota archaeon]